MSRPNDGIRSGICPPLLAILRPRPATMPISPRPTESTSRRPPAPRDARRGLLRPGDGGLYATDASLYQIEPIGVVVPRTADDVAATVVKIAAEEHVPIVPRGAATSLSGQTIGAGDRHRLFQVSQSDRDRRPRCDDGTGRAGRGARPAQCPSQADGADVRARRLDQRSRHDRRDDRQQLGRRALAPIRQDGGPRPRRRGRPGRRHDGDVRARPGG